ncbi:MAG: sigma-70 family RNA polymerase sigma factor [Bacteroidales bacterium]|nr:sigma-70 family RNA polymerase sigma factor [Candidatus Colicola faecequi]
MDGPKRTEKELLRLINEGDEQARYLLYAQYSRYLSAVCSRYIADDEDLKDVLQESFLKIFRSIGDFGYRGEGSLKAWMSRIVLNESLVWLKQRRHLSFAELDDEAMNLPDAPPDTEGIPAEAIHRMIRALPDGYRTVFNLYVIEEKSHREIAALLGIKESTSASQLHRAKALLAAMITQFRNDNDTTDGRLAERHS